MSARNPADSPRALFSLFDKRIVHRFLGYRPLLFILLGAFLLRAAAGVGLQMYLDRLPDRDFLIEGDANGYWALAEKLAAGEEYSTGGDYPRRVLRMPGFPLLLALSIKLSGGSMLFTRLLLAAVGTLACGLVYLLGKQLFDRTTGLIAAGLTAVSPLMIGTSVLVLSETLFAAALTGSLIVVAKLAASGGVVSGGLVSWSRSVPGRSRGDTPRLQLTAHHSPASPLLALLAGAAIAIATYVRPSWLLAGPIVAVLLVLLARDRARAAFAAVLLLLGTAVALAPWTYRNYAVTGRFIPTTLWVGPSLYDGLNPEADGTSDMTFIEDDDLRARGLSEYEVDRHYRRRAWEFVRSQPARTLELAGRKLARYWSPWPHAAEVRNAWLQAPIALFFVLIAVPAVYGWWKLRRQPWLWLLTVGPILYFAAIHAVFVGSIRYRLPAEYPLCVMAAAGIRLWLAGRDLSSVSKEA